MSRPRRWTRGVRESASPAFAISTRTSAHPIVNNRRHPVDCIYIAACARDARLTRICVASIRYFYPDVPITLLAGDILQRGLAKQLKRYWNVDLADLPLGDYGWGLVKLEPLFGPSGQRFMVCDVDTIF